MDANQLRDNVLRAEGYAQGYGEGFRAGYSSCAKFVADDLSKQEKSIPPIPTEIKEA